MSERPRFLPYGRPGRDTGVREYALAPGAIHVRFRSGEVYVYDVRHTGREHVEQMTRLAELGAGLSTYISRHVHDRFARKESAP